MKPKITFVVDEPAILASSVGEDGVGSEMRFWRATLIVQSLVDAGAAVEVFRGGLQDAPDSWAYVLLNGYLDSVAAHPGVRARFPRTIGLISIREACRDADRFGLAGAIDERGIPNPDHDTPERLNFICVRRDIAEKLGWELLGPISSPYRYEGIWGLPIPIGQLILTYLRALLGDPAEASPPSSPPTP